MLWIDFETFNGVKDISVGTYEYARTCEILLVAYAIDDGPAQLWDVTTAPAPLPILLRTLNDPDEPITAHHSQFDRAVLREQLAPLLNLPAHAADPARWRCTMCQALAHGFPGSLDQLGRILGLPTDQAKLTEGKKLINRFCKPAPRNHKADRYDAHTHPEEWARFGDYAVRDIDAMRAIAALLPTWNFGDTELALYRLDQRINDRGFLVDGELVEAGARASGEEKTRIAERCNALTGGRVPRPTMREALRLYLNGKFGLDLPNTQAATLREALADQDLPADARELMGAALSANKTSTSKFKALAPAVSPDDRFRGGLQFAGAARTRRWSGRVFQPQNLASRGLPPQDAIDLYIDALKHDVHDLLFHDQMLFASAALRGVVIAPDGRKLVVADLSNIEGRGNAWLSGEQWKIEAFAAFDRGEGPDLYNIMGGSILGKRPYDLSKSERNAFGKVPELACQYHSGVNGIQTFARAYGITLSDHWQTIQRTMGAFVAEAEEHYETWGRERQPDLDRVEWIASETIKLAWRWRHPMIVRMWRACQDAATNAIRNPGRSFTAGSYLRFKVVSHGGHRYLAVRLPSGRFLTYFHPALLDDGTITYWGVNGLTRQWERTTTYGGKLLENATQSISRDILADRLPAIEAAGYDILFTVHDEVVTEAPDTAAFNAKALSEIMAVRPAWAPWAPYLPLAAAGFEAYRYRKD